MYASIYKYDVMRSEEYSLLCFILQGKFKVAEDMTVEKRHNSKALPSDSTEICTTELFRPVTSWAQVSITHKNEKEKYKYI